MVNLKKEWEKHKASKTKPEELDFLNKEQEKGELWKLKKRLNDKDTCQMYRGNFIKKK